MPLLGGWGGQREMLCERRRPMVKVGPREQRFRVGSRPVAVLNEPRISSPDKLHLGSVARESFSLRKPKLRDPAGE